MFTFDWKKSKKCIPNKSTSPFIISKVASHALKENPTPPPPPPSQRTIAKPLNISVGTVNKIVKSDVKLI